MKRITVRAGERTRILHMFSDSIPQTVRFTAAPTSGEDVPVSGRIEVERGFLGSGQRASQPLAAENELRKGFWDIVYSVYVTPDRDAEIAFQTRHFTAKALFLVLGAVALIGLVAGLGAYLANSGD